jgi:hypothetical protein
VSMEDIEIIPPGTLISEPDDLHRVMLTFKTQEEAILFFQVLGQGLKALGRVTAAIDEDLRMRHLEDDER